MKADVIDVPAIAVQFNFALDETRSIGFSTGVAQDVPVEDFNELLDKLVTAADRQQAKYKVISLEKHIAQSEKFYIQREEDLLRIDEEVKVRQLNGGRRLAKLSPKEEQERQQVLIMRDRLRDDIIKKREELAEYKRMLNGAHGPADSDVGGQDSAGA